jgi:hypothetical protein
VPADGYLSVFLYRADAKVAEDSKLVSRPASRSVEFPLLAPAEVGSYRAVVFWRPYGAPVRARAPLTASGLLSPG